MAETTKLAKDWKAVREFISRIPNLTEGTCIFIGGALVLTLILVFTGKRIERFRIPFEAHHKSVVAAVLTYQLVLLLGSFLIHSRIKYFVDFSTPGLVLKAFMIVTGMMFAGNWLPKLSYVGYATGMSIAWYPTLYSFLHHYSEFDILEFLRPELFINIVGLLSVLVPIHGDKEFPVILSVLGLLAALCYLWFVEAYLANTVTFPDWLIFFQDELQKGVMNKIPLGMQFVYWNLPAWRVVYTLLVVIIHVLWSCFLYFIWLARNTLPLEVFRSNEDELKLWEAEIKARREATAAASGIPRGRDRNGSQGTSSTASSARMAARRGEGGGRKHVNTESLASSGVEMPSQQPIYSAPRTLDQKGSGRDGRYMNLPDDCVEISVDEAVRLTDPQSRKKPTPIGSKERQYEVAIDASDSDREPERATGTVGSLAALVGSALTGVTSRKPKGADGLAKIAPIASPDALKDGKANQAAFVEKKSSTGGKKKKKK